MLTVLSMFSPCTQWVFGPLSPVTTTIGGGSLKIAKGNFTFSGSKIGTLYQCTMYAEKPLGARSLSSVEKPLPIKTLHDRMGHLNWEALKSIRAANPPLLGVKLDASNPAVVTKIYVKNMAGLPKNDAKVVGRMCHRIMTQICGKVRRRVTVNLWQGP